MTNLTVTHDHGTSIGIAVGDVEIDEFVSRFTAALSSVADALLLGDGAEEVPA